MYLKRNVAIMAAMALAMLQIALACDLSAQAGDGSLGKLCANAVCFRDEQCFSGKCLPKGYLTEESICDGAALLQTDSPASEHKGGAISLGLLIGLISAGVLIVVFCIIFCFCRGVISCILDCICCCCPRRKETHHHYEHVHHHK